MTVFIPQGTVFIPVTEISVEKTEILETGATVSTRLLISLNTLKFFQRKEWQSEILETEPAQFTALIKRGPK